MTTRGIFFAGSLICLGIFILLGIYIWKGSGADTTETELNKQTYTKQSQDLPKAETGVNTSKTNPVGTQSAGTGKPAASTTMTAENTSSQAANSASSSATKGNKLFSSGYKVGDLIKLGDVEVVVTKSTSRHKVIDITLEGNSSDQPPKLVLSKSNRIVYEVPADVDVNIDVTEKTAIDQSPLLDNEKEAGK